MKPLWARTAKDAALSMTSHAALSTAPNLGCRFVHDLERCVLVVFCAAGRLRLIFIDFINFIVKRNFSKMIYCSVFELLNQ